MLIQNIIKLNDENFEKYVIKSKFLFLVYFGADWCGPCNIMLQILQEILKEKTHKILIGKININDNNKVTLKYEINNIPTLLLFRYGNIIYTQIGLITKNELLNILNKNL